MALAGLIGGALKGDARSLMALETTGIDDALLREAVGLVAGGSAGGAAIAVGQFAATIILRHARTSEGADLGALCTECLQLAATPGLPTNRQLLSAAAAAATRAGPEAALQVHAEAMRLARLGQLAEGGAPAASPLTALHLVHALAEEAGRAVVTSSVREALAGQGAEVFALLNSVLRGSGGERGVSGGLECLSQWAETLGVGMDAVLATEGLLLALCSLVASEDESVVDSLADCLEALLTRPFAGTPATNPTIAAVVWAAVADWCRAAQGRRVRRASRGAAMARRCPSSARRWRPSARASATTSPCCTGGACAASPSPSPRCWSGTRPRRRRRASRC